MSYEIGDMGRGMVSVSDRDIGLAQPERAIRPRVAMLAARIGEKAFRAANSVAVTLASVAVTAGLHMALPDGAPRPVPRDAVVPISVSTGGENTVSNDSSTSGSVGVGHGPATLPNLPPTTGG